jgi:hypothetical protein
LVWHGRAPGIRLIDKWGGLFSHWFVHIITPVNFNGSFWAWSEGEWMACRVCYCLLLNSCRQNTWCISKPNFCAVNKIEAAWKYSHVSLLMPYKEIKWKPSIHKNDFMWPLKRLRTILKTPWMLCVEEWGCEQQCTLTNNR